MLLLFVVVVCVVCVVLVVVLVLLLVVVVLVVVKIYLTTKVLNLQPSSCSRPNVPLETPSLQIAGER